MSLLLRCSPAEYVLRSVDERPGIVGLALFDRRHAFTIDTAIEPMDSKAQMDALLAAHPTGGSVLDLSRHNEPADPETRLSVEDAIAAAEGRMELMMLVRMAAGAITASHTLYSPRLGFELVADACQFAIDVRDAGMARLKAESQ